MKILIDKCYLTIGSQTNTNFKPLNRNYLASKNLTRWRVNVLHLLKISKSDYEFNSSNIIKKIITISVMAIKNPR